MTFDDGHGKMRLSRDRLRIDWLGAGHERVFRSMAVRLAKLTDAMGGRYVINPLWSRMFGRRLLTVHPLGGCGMSDDATEGVVNHLGQVYNAVDDRPNPDALHKGLYVCDGSIIPTPLGVNPALTISALAERIAEKSLEQIPHAVRKPARVARIDPGVAGIRYAEHLRGRMVLNGCATPVDFVLHLSSDSVTRAIRDPEHTVGLTGTAYAKRLPKGLQRFFLSEGTFKFAVDDPRVVDGTVAIYQFKLTSTDGHEFWLLGHKAINADTCKRSVWKAATRMSFVVFDGDRRVPKSLSRPIARIAAYRFWAAVDECIGDANLPALLEKVRSLSAVGAGICAGTPTDVLKLAASIEIVNEPRVLRRLWLGARFQWPFFDALVQSRVWALRRTTRFNPFEKKVEGRPQPHRVLRDKKQPGHPRYELRYCCASSEEPGQKPAVVLVPGFAMSTYWFRAPFPAPRKNLTEFLIDRGYDVWLLDYRPSNRVAASLDQFTIDDVVDDLPDAMAQVREQVGGRPFQVVAHCVGSLAMLMCLLKGKLRGAGIQSMILSQSFAFIDQPMINQIKARLHLAEVLQFLGVRPVLTTEFDVRSSIGTRLLDRLLYFYPSRERCRSGVCRRLLLIYGEANRHAELDQIAHNELYNMVDRGNLRAIAHLQRMVARHRLVNARGEDVYVTRANAANVDIPLGLLHGAKNNLFRRSGALKTFEWLKDHGKDVELIDLPNSGHMDGYIGPNAEADVFPKIDDYLKKTRPIPASGAPRSLVAAL